MKRAHIAIVIAAAILAMVWLLGNDIVYDAAALLQADQRFDLPIDWNGLASRPYWYQGLWRPATLLFLGAQVHLAGGIVPVALHTVSLVLYIATTVLLVLTARQLGGHTASVVSAGVLFAVHPLHVEVVASIVGQAELLCALALLGAMLLWHRAATQGSGNGLLLGLVGLQLLAAGAKEQGYLLPILLLGQQVLLEPRLHTRTAVRWLGILLLLAVTLYLIRADVTGSLAGEAAAPYFLGVSPIERSLAALGVLPKALAMLLIPLGLGLEYGPPGIAIDGRFSWLQAGGLAIIIGVLAAMVAWRKRFPLASFGLWIVAVTWLPASSLVVPAGLLLADRVLFLPTAGLTLALAAVPWPAAVSARRTVMAVVVVVALCFGVVSNTRIRVWRDADTFYGAMTRDNPESYRAWFVRAIHERNAGRSKQAETMLRHSLELWPRVPSVHEELGQLLRAQGRCAEAIPIFREGLALDTARFQLRAKLAECENQVSNTTRAFLPR